MNTKPLNILYEDTHILVCVKSHGIATQSRKLGSPDMVSLLKNHIAHSNHSKGEPYLAVIHRLTGIRNFGLCKNSLRCQRTKPPAYLP